MLKRLKDIKVKRPEIGADYYLLEVKMNGTTVTDNKQKIYTRNL